MTRGVKADKIEVEERVNIVLGLIYRGWNSKKIVQNISVLWKFEDERQGWDYLRKARRRIEAIYRQKQEHGLADMLARHEDLRDKGYTDRDHRLVLDVDKEDAKLLGLYAPTKVAPTDPTGQKEYNGLSDEERTKRLFALLKQAGVDIGEG